MSDNVRNAVGLNVVRVHVTQDSRLRHGRSRYDLPCRRGFVLLSRQDWL